MTPEREALKRLVAEFGKARFAVGDSGQGHAAAEAAYERVCKAIDALSQPPVPAVEPVAPTDEQCDKAAAQAMGRVAAAKGMHALEINPDVTKHHTLRRELIRAGWSLYASPLAAAPNEPMPSAPDSCSWLG